MLSCLWSVLGTLISYTSSQHLETMISTVHSRTWRKLQLRTSQALTYQCYESLPPVETYRICERWCHTTLTDPLTSPTHCVANADCPYHLSKWIQYATRSCGQGCAVRESRPLPSKWGNVTSTSLCNLGGDYSFTKHNLTIKVATPSNSQRSDFTPVHLVTTSMHYFVARSVPYLRTPFKTGLVSGMFF